MDSEEELFQRYRPVARLQANEILLGWFDALRFIADCRALRLVVLGMDFWAQHGDQVAPLLSSADYSDLARRMDAVEASSLAALKLIRDGLPDGASYVSFVLAPEPADMST